MGDWKKEFPEMVGEGLGIEIPKGFEDTSWRNEAGPSFFDENRRLVLFVERARPEDREFQDCERYVLKEALDRDGAVPFDHLLATDDADEVLARIAAHDAVPESAGP